MRTSSERPTLQAAWSYEVEAPMLLRARGQTCAMIGESGAAYVFSHQGELRAFAGERAFQGLAVGGDGHVFLTSPKDGGSLVALGDGGARWQVSLRASALGRVFTRASACDVVVLLSRDGRFVMERYDQRSGDFIERRTLERYRGLVDDDETHVWTRGQKGISSFRIGDHRVRRTPLPGNGAVGARGELAATCIGRDRVALVDEDGLRWTVQLAGRDLADAARRDGFDADDTEFEGAGAGRPLIHDARVFVPDVNAALHVFRLDDGELLRTFESEGYPTMERPPRPVEVEAGLVFLSSDERLHLLSFQGEALASIELPAEPQGPLASAGELAFLHVDGGLHAYHALTPR